MFGHFAGALGIPTIIPMNGVIDQRRWKPIGERVRVIQGIDKNHICRYDKDRYPCPNMSAIKIEEVCR